METERELTVEAWLLIFPSFWRGFVSEDMFWRDVLLGTEAGIEFVRLMTIL